MTEPVTEVSINQYKRVIRDMDRESIIRFQLICHCCLNQIKLNTHGLQCLTVLGMLGKTDLSQFCEMMKSENIFTSVLSARSRLTILQEAGLILKDHSKYRKTVQLHPNMKIQTTGNILVDMKLLSMETINVPKESEGDNN